MANFKRDSKIFVEVNADSNTEPELNVRKSKAT